jgi:hypothetical protein
MKVIELHSSFGLDQLTLAERPEPTYIRFRVLIMDRRRASVTVLRAIALLATACVHQSFGHAPEAETPAQIQLTEVVELPHQTLAFKPTRDDITVGCAIVSLSQSDLGKALPLESIRVNGVQPKSARLYLKRVGKNRFELPAVKIEFSSKELGGPLYLNIKVWFNELTNQYDSPFYERVPDRYALLSYCTKEDDDPSKVNARLGANRVASLKEFRERLGKPFVIQLNQQPLREEWGRWPMINNAARKLSDADLKAIEQSVRDRGEKYVINISAQDRDHAVVGVGDHDLFEGTRVYELARTDGTWQIEKVEDRQ